MKALIFCAISASLAIDVRLMALIFPALTVFFVVYLWLNKEISGKNLLNYFLIFLVITIITVVIFWPFLWANPLEHFLNALSRMSKFPRVVSMTFMGKGIYGDNLPWYYIPVWIGVTTPIFYTAMFIAGSIGIGFKLITTNPMQLSKIQASNYFIAALFFGPLLAVVLLKSNLYNGWRHLYFLYIPFVIISMNGFTMLWRYFHSKYIHLFLCLLASSTFLFQGWWIYKNHPYQYLYFNLLAGKWSQNYDVDYWGVAYPRLINKIISQNSTEKFSIFSAPESWNGWQQPYIWNLFLLNPSDANRIESNPSEDCSNYIIGDYKKSVQYLSNANFSTFDTLEINGQIVYSTFKRKNLLPIEISKDKNSEVLFSNSNNKCYLYSGWGGTESWGTWSTSTIAKIRLPFAPSNLRFVNLELRPFISEKVKNQPIIISVNGSKVNSISLGEQRTIKVPIPAKQNAEGFWEISIEIPRATSPKSIGLSDDDRPLGLGIIKASYE
jgi:hypothetical protein